MDIQKRILLFITRANWVLFVAAVLVGLVAFQFDVALGIFAGGLIVTVNFHLLARTLKKSLTPPHLVSHNVIIAKYYVRFIASGVIIFFLISGHYVDPLGLFVGLSVVVASIVVATVRELKNLIFKEAF
ncbi:MAG: ATP synthase subunit I [Desulfobacteraceae bacterium]|nr:ATP synthase subunit I [Desulfobacteraceae bacterium]MBC2750469.1 ATP synthase subunit I [Desulfobacteraceae bacterium]